MKQKIFRPLWPLIILLILVVIFRLPTLFEPLWYADEGIYLTIGEALRAKWQLYNGIFDHKTPLIYFLAAIFGSRLIIWRSLGIILSLIATVFFYGITRHFFHSRHWWISTLATLFFIIFMNFPWLEGNVVNGEIFFLTFGLGGIFFWLHSKILTTPSSPPSSRLQIIFGTLSGIFFSLAFLCKFHGLADLAAIALPTLLLTTSELKKNRHTIISLCIGFLTPILLTIIFFLCQQNLNAFIQNAFLFSFEYSSYQQLGSSIITQFLFSTKGKLFLLAFFVIVVWIARRHLTPLTVFPVWWLIISIVATTLSNRNYPHYFLQLVPALTLTLFFLTQQIYLLIIKIKSTRQSSTHQLSILDFSLTFLIIIALIYLFFIAHHLEFKLFDPDNRNRQAAPYYLNFFNYAFNRQNLYAFYQFFDPQLKDNYAIAPVIALSPQHQILVWGNNPQLYALTHTLPLTSFTTNYHAYDDFFDTRQTPSTSLISSWDSTNPPPFVIMMHNFSPYSDRSSSDQNFVQHQLDHHYQIVYQGDSLTLWQLKNYDT